MKHLFLISLVLSSITFAKVLTYAQVKNGAVVNTILLEEKSNHKPFLDGFDKLIPISHGEGVGWTYDGKEFHRPKSEK